VYREQTHPLAEVYAERGLLQSVDALGEPEDVTERILSAVGDALGGDVAAAG
jgi:adenylate kinase